MFDSFDKNYLRKYIQWYSSCSSLISTLRKGRKDLHERVLNKKRMTIYKVSGVLQSHENYLRLLTAIDHAGLELYFKAFHDAENGGIGFPTEPEKLYKQLLTLQEDFKAMKANGDISAEEYATLLPGGKETFTQEFGLQLFQKLLKHLYAKNGGGTVDEEKSKFLKEMEKLQILQTDKTLVTKFQRSFDISQEKWDEVLQIFKSLNYDVSKIESLQTGDLDENKKYRFALLRSEINVLLFECDDCMKTVMMNQLALEKLKGNFQVALSESQEDNNNEKAETEFEELNSLKEEVVKSQNKLKLHSHELQELIPSIKFWRQKNIEGDIIVFDERLTQLRNEINEQTHRVGDLFNTVSFDIVRIKERTCSLNGENIRHISPPPTEHVH